MSQYPCSPRRVCSLFPIALASFFTVLLAGALHAEEARPEAHQQPHGTQTLAMINEPVGLDFPADRDWVEVPFRLESNKIILPIRINGSEPLDAVLDTGASSALMIDHEMAAKLDFNIVGQAQVAGAGAGSDLPPVEVARDVRFELGELTLGGLNLAVMRGPSHLDKMNWQAIIGQQIFDNLVVQIDWDKTVLRFADPARFEAGSASGGSAIIALERERGHIFARGEIVIDRGPAKPVKMVIDSGAYHALALDGRGLDALPEKRIDGAKLGRGLGGVIRGGKGRISELRLGSFTFRDVLADFPEADVADIITGGSDGNLGAEILRRFLITFDYSRDQMILKPAAAMNESFDFSTAGIALFPSLNDAGAGIVDDLYPGSPAIDAGLREGDEILRIDGTKLSKLGLDRARQLLEQEPGSELELDVRRGSKTFTLVLTLATLL